MRIKINNKLDPSAKKSLKRAVRYRRQKRIWIYEDEEEETAAKKSAKKATKRSLEKLKLIDAKIKVEPVASDQGLEQLVVGVKTTRMITRSSTRSSSSTAVSVGI